MHMYADSRMRKGVKKCAQTHGTGEDLFASKYTASNLNLMKNDWNEYI